MAEREVIEISGLEELARRLSGGELVIRTELINAEKSILRLSRKPETVRQKVYLPARFHVVVQAIANRMGRRIADRLIRKGF